jgi:tetratricopeptide (TPR) repeat protein
VRLRSLFISLFVAALPACKTTITEERSIRFSEKTTAADPTVLDSKIKQLEDLSQKYPKRADLPYQMAGVYFQKEDYHESARALERAIYIEPSEAKFHYHLGRIYMKMRELDRAEAAFRKALELMPSDRYTGGHAALGYVLCQRGHWEEARSEFEACARINPKDVTPLYFLGCVADAEKDSERAVSFLKRYLEAGGTTYRQKAVNLLASYGVEAPPIPMERLEDKGPKAAAAERGPASKEASAGSMESELEGLAPRPEAAGKASSRG